MSGELVLGIDVGGTKLAGVATNGAAVVAEGRRVLVSGRALGDQVIDLARELITVAGNGAVTGIGLAVPGQVDTASGVIELAVNLEVRGLPIGSIVSAELGAPCFVEHDARAVAAWIAADRHESALAYVSVGTGVSAGVVLDGRVLHGTDGIAGEIGHTLGDPSGPRCACGLIGCVEALASGPAVARAAAESIAAGTASSLSRRPSTADVYAAAAQGDPLAEGIVMRAATHIAAAIRGIALAFGVRSIVVGGGVARAGEAFAAPLRAALDRERDASALVAQALPRNAVEVLDDERPLGALGAAAVARTQVQPAVPAVGREVGQR
ncbi:MAG: ROK family protein [Candidatus Limnocylindria bacterium]